MKSLNYHFIRKILVVIIMLFFVLSFAIYAKDPIPLNDPNRFKGIELTIACDEFAKGPFEWYADELEKECGVKIKTVQVYRSQKDMEIIMPKLLGQMPWDIIVGSGTFMPDFIATGNVQPLDEYLDKYEGTDKYLEDVIPAYREWLNKSGGHVYSLMMDGDVHVLHYRPSYFNNEEYKKQFESEYGYPLNPPDTWDQYLDLCKFFDKVLPEGIYPTQFQGGRPPNYGWFFDIAASMGVNYFDEEMNPQINSPEGVKALEILVEMAKYSPPGVETFTGDPDISNWQQGKVVFNVWYVDLREFTALADVPIIGDTADMVIPGTKQSNGEIVRRAMLPFCRIAFIPKNIPDERKEAAFYVAYRLSQYDYSKYSVADPYTGLDPYLWSHFSDEAIAQYTKPNPLRGTSVDYPQNIPIFKTFEEAKQHIDATKGSLSIGFPQLTLPGAADYVDSLGIQISRAVAGEVSAKEALDIVAAEWKKILEERGIEEQKKLYAEYLKSGREFGYWK